MIETDILVIGAGPAGSAAAKHAALGGADVILIDKKSEIGTPKRCAEGIYDHGLKWLGIEPDPQWAVQRINGGTIIAPDGTRLTLDETILPEKGYIIERKVFDKYMAMDAARAGAKIMVKTIAKSIMRDEDDKGSFFIVDCEHMGEIIEIKARILIAADGPESRIAKALGINSTTNPKDMMSGVQYEMVGVNCERMDLIGATSHSLDILRKK
jgi:digeranylgeranylglycerophospholipid reductase